MTSVFQGLCLSRSMGRVGENPGYEVAIVMGTVRMTVSAAYLILLSFKILCQLYYYYLEGNLLLAKQLHVDGKFIAPLQTNKHCNIIQSYKQQNNE